MSSPDELPELEGIDASDEFRRYVAELRQTWVPTDDRAVSPAKNRDSTTQTPMSTESSTDCTDCATFTRRGFMRAGATAAVTSATVGAGAGNVAAVDGLDVAGDYVQAPFISGTVTAATHESDFATLDYVDDSGEQASLDDMGAQVAERVDDETPHNPITLEAANFDADDYSAFPREKQYDEDGDGDANTDVTALDATHWTVDESSSAGTMTVEDKTSPADGPGLRISTSSQTTGDVALATFDSSYVDITDGEDRKLMQLVLDADTVEAGVVVTFRVRDEDGDVREAVIDPSGDTANAGVIAASTVQSHVYQVPMGELPQTNNGDGTFNNISEFEIEIAEANADISLYALNLERESEWVYGVEEFTNSDDELDTQEITEPSGAYSITGFDTIEPPLADAYIADKQLDVELVANKLPDDMVEFEWSEADRYDYPYRLKTVFNLEAETAYDLSWALDALNDEVLFPSSRFIEAGIATNQSEAVTLADIDNDDVSLTDRTSTYGDGSIEQEIELSTAVQAGDYQAVYLDILYNEEERTEAESTAAVGPTGGGSSGWADYLFSLPGMLISGVVGYLAIAKSGVLGAVR